MKRKTTALFTLITLFCLASSCNTQAVERTGEKVTQNFPVSKFHSIHYSLVGNLEFTQGPKTSVNIQAPAKILKDIQATVKDGVLYLEYKKKASKNQNGKSEQTVIKISSPKLENLDIEGVGNVDIKGVLQTDVLHINSSSVGNLNISDLRSKKLEVKNSSVGNIRLTGQADKAIFYSSVVGNIHAYRLKAKEVYANSSAVGNVECYASEAIEIHSSAVGNVSYKGSPAKKEIYDHSLGKVKQVR